MTRLVIGIDPDSHGGMVALDTRGIAVGALAANHGDLAYHPPDRAARREAGHPAERIDRAVAFLVGRALVGNYEDVIVLVELQQARSGQARQTIAVRLQGIAEGVAAARRCDLYTVNPRDWHGWTNTSSKAEAVAWCAAHIPSLDLRPGRTRKPHEGLADAGCIAAYGLHRFGGGWPA